MKPVAVALVEARAPGPRELEALRRRLARAGGSSREAVLLDSLEDDLAESRRALAAVGDYLARVEGALREPRAARHRLLALARYFGPAQELEYLEANLGRLRRRLAQVSERLPRTP